MMTIPISFIEFMQIWFIINSMWVDGSDYYRLDVMVLKEENFVIEKKSFFWLSEDLSFEY
jgi:hypothetical protein